MQDEDTVMDSSPPSDVVVKATFRLLVPANAAGSIIGQKGEFIRKIRDKCKPGAYLRVPEMPQSSERLVLITCELDDIPIIIKQLCRPIFKALKEDHSIPDEHCGELLLLVNSQQAGRIVGKGGEKLKAIRLETGCERFKIYKDRLPFSEERVCEIKGSEDSVALAVQQAIEILATHPLDHDHQHYMPFCDTLGDCSGEWGGYLRFKGISRRDEFKQPPRRDYSSDSHRYERSSYDPLPPHNYSYPPRSRALSGDRNMRHSCSDSRDRSRERGYERERSPVRSSVKDIYVDDCYTKHVIGSKGSQIAKIRRQSGADVQIAKDETVQNGERKISICGRPKDIDCALQLINEAIAEKINRDRKNGVTTTMKSCSGAAPPGPDFDYVNELFDRISSVITFSDIQNTDPSPLEETVVIPNSETATVIGPKGIRIKDIRQYTQCEIKIQDDKEVEGDRRKVTLRGSARQIHRAAFMVQNIAKVMR